MVAGMSAVAAPVVPTTAEAVLTDRESAQVEQANASGRRPVVFIHGLWLLPESWSRWATLFEGAGYAPLTPGWPGDPETRAEAIADPQRFAGNGIERVAVHHAAVIGRLDTKPAVIGHSFGGLLAQIVAGRGLAAATVSISPAPFRGVLSLPISALRASAPVLGKPSNRKRAVTLTFAQFRYAFANAVPEDEARRLYDDYHVAAPGLPIFQAATANLNPRTEARVDTENPQRGPLLVLSGDKDHTVPWAIANAAYKRQRPNPSITEIEKISGHGHALTIDDGWRDAAEKALAFVRRYA
jgi:pimeloyl-ACP methyl ester carboxylesterase